jgi:hypothetical protein
MIFLTSWRKVATPSLDFVKSTTILDITNSKEDGEGWWRVVKGCCYLPLCCRTCVRLHVKNPHHNLLNLINWRQVSLKVEWHSRGGDHEITIVFLWSTRLKRLTAWCWLPIASIIHYEMFAVRFFFAAKRCPIESIQGPSNSNGSSLHDSHDPDTQQRQFDRTCCFICNMNDGLGS